MTKARKSPTILKPTIDEKMALQFASAVSPSPSDSVKDGASATLPHPGAAKKPSPGRVAKNMRQISLTLTKHLYAKISKEAAHKNRTVEEHLIKHLTKRYEE
jgi:hypothetical protein